MVNYLLDEVKYLHHYFYLYLSVSICVPLKNLDNINYETYNKREKDYGYLLCRNPFPFSSIRFNKL